MNIVIDKTAVNRKKSNKLQQRFEHLQAQLKKKQRQQQKFKKEIDELVKNWHQQSAEQDASVAEPLIALTSKLIKFYSRKSIAEWQRHDLVEWISENLSRISRSNREASKELAGYFEEVVASLNDLSVEAFREELKQAKEAEEKRHADFFAEDEDEKAKVEIEDEAEDDIGYEQDDLFGFDDVFFDEGDPQATSDESFFSNEPSIDDNKAAFDDKWIKALFKRALQALHPDREKDQEKQLVKQQLIKQLLEARKQNDIVTLLTIYTEHVSEEELSVAKDQMENICQLLKTQIDELEDEQQGYLFEHPDRFFVYKQFYSRSAKARNKKLKLFFDDLEAESESILNLTDYLRNLSCLREVMIERSDAMMMPDMDELMSMFDE